MTDGLRKSHLRKAPQVGLSEVGLPEGNPYINQINVIFLHECCTLQPQDGYNHTCVKGEEKNCDKFFVGKK